jgi:tRNA(Ile)-lysidine synthase
VEIEAHLRHGGQGWVEDASNRDPRFLRNHLRHEVLPVLAETFGPDVVPRLCRSAALSRRLVEALEDKARAELRRLAAPGPCGLVLAVEALRALPVDLAAETLLQAAAELGETRPLRRATHRRLRRLLASERPRRPLRLGRLTLERSGRWLRVGPAQPPALAPREWRIPGLLELCEVGLALDARCFERPPGYAPPRDASRAAFDADRLPSALAVRSRRRGDRFTPFRGAGPRRLKAFLIDAGLPRWERARLPLLEAEGEIIWVAGVRRGASAPVDEGTRRILEVTLHSPWRRVVPAE